MGRGVERVSLKPRVWVYREVAPTSWYKTEFENREAEEQRHSDSLKSKWLSSTSVRYWLSSFPIPISIDICSQLQHTTTHNVTGSFQVLCFDVCHSRCRHRFNSKPMSKADPICLCEMEKEIQRQTQSHSNLTSPSLRQHSIKHQTRSIRNPN